MDGSERVAAEDERDRSTAGTEHAVEAGARLAHSEHPPVELHVVGRMRRLLDRDDSIREITPPLLLLARLVRRDRHEDGEPMSVPLRRHDDRHELDPVAQHQAAIRQSVAELGVPQPGPHVLEHRQLPCPAETVGGVDVHRLAIATGEELAVHRLIRVNYRRVDESELAADERPPIPRPLPAAGIDRGEQHRREVAVGGIPSGVERADVRVARFQELPILLVQRLGALRRRPRTRVSR